MATRKRSSSKTSPTVAAAAEPAARYLGHSIRIRGARQNNLKNLDLDIHTGELTVVTGVSGSGKSSLVFDTLYAEGQRRYVETFSPYARQFLDRMDKPQVDRIEGIPPAIAIDQVNPVRTSRSTVGTMTELNDHLKLLFARVARRHCSGCGRPVRRDTPASVIADVLARARALAAEDPDARLHVTFPVPVPPKFSEAEIEQFLAAQGYTRIHAREGDTLHVLQDRFKVSSIDRERMTDAIEQAMHRGQGRVDVHAGTTWKYSSTLHCPHCDILYADPTPATFSFNNPIGACESCRGFGRVIGLDLGLVIPDESKTLAEGAVRPWQTESFKDTRVDLEKHGKKRGLAMDVPWRELPADHRAWVIDGDPDFVSWEKSWPGKWYGVRRFFDWLESKAYKMHIRVLLSKYRAYTHCGACDGARLKPGALDFRLGTKDDADAVLAPSKRMHPKHVRYRREVLEQLPGLTIHDLMLMPIDKLRQLFDRLRLDALIGEHDATQPLPDDAAGTGAREGGADDLEGAVMHAEDEATRIVLGEVRGRSRYLCEVGLGYLTLDRQSRTLSGGEVQRINLTTALGTSLVNTLFVLDEPSIGLHPRDMSRVIGVMDRLRSAGNTLVVVEHDPQIMFAADRLLDIGPGPGERGGEIVFDGPPRQLARSGTSLTADYLLGRKRLADVVPRLAVHLPGGPGSAPALPMNDAEADAAAVSDPTPALTLTGAAEHNLKGIDVTFPLARLVCVTGVSGSGKSTLVQDVLYPALCKALGKPVEAPGAHRALEGAALVEDVVMVDQTAIGKTARSNPASYVGAFDAIRTLFAKAPLAQERQYTAGTFSFNAGAGRCPVCMGSGFEHVEMQFLSDVYLRCAECDGTRFRAEVREVTVGGKSVSEVLDLTVSEALAFLASVDGGDEAIALLSPLADVGLEYVRLGQPVPTLSGGEAQRLKLAGHLAENASNERSAARAARRAAGASASAAASKATTASRTKGGRLAKAGKAATREPRMIATGGEAPTGKLFIFDEPTTGLHFDDIAKLLRAFARLRDAGHSLLVIEHNLDVIAAADWVIDLGPEGGDGGGELVAAGTPEQLRRHPASHTGRALRDYTAGLAQLVSDNADASSAPPGKLGHSPREADAPALAAMEPSGAYLAERAARGADAIRILHAREHNLKNVSVDIPRRGFTVLTGPSGSGKSTLAFDIVFNEGQRRYLESLNAYARQFVQPTARPDVDAIHGIPPTVAIEQRTSRGGRKSTVGTLTEVYHFLRLLWMKLGTQHCPKDGVPIEPQTIDGIAARLLRDARGQRVSVLAPLVVARKGLYTDLAKWARARGFYMLRVDGQWMSTDPFPRLDRYKEHTLELPVAEVEIDPANEAALRTALSQALEHGKGTIHVLPLAPIKKGQRSPGPVAAGDVQVFSTRRACPVCGMSFPEPDPRLFSFNSKHGWCDTCQGTGVALEGFERDERTSEENLDRAMDDWLDERARERGARDGEDVPCPECHGARLNPVARAVRFRDAPIAEVCAQPVKDVAGFVERLKLAPREAEIARDVIAEVKGRLSFLDQVGLGYLALDRAAPTLSGGEAQRIRLAAQLGSNLQGVAYVLDEPTIGLHPRDNRVLLDTLELLERKGNTLLVVEHDEDTIRRAHHVIDLGPGAGSRGGEIVAQGTADELMRDPASLTGRFLARPLEHPLQPYRPVPKDHPFIEIKGARLHNLKAIDACIPLSRLTVFTGVSGSGKSSLARDVVETNLEALLAARAGRGAGAKAAGATKAPRGRGPAVSTRAKAAVAEARSARTASRAKATAELALVGCDAIEGWEPVDRILEVDQTPIGKTPRSCPATYVGFWDAIRKLYAESNEARLRGWGPGRFSFNTSGGRCEACEGAGMKTIEMNFLPDVKMPCDVCRGARFNAETLRVTWREKSIGDVLRMSVDDAVEFFASSGQIHGPLKLLQDVGLGYLTLGQASPTLSGGEAQRIKLVTELVKARLDAPPRTGRPNPHTLYVLDEPTVGLHMSDVEKLIRVLHRLVDAGSTVVLVEHDLDMIAEADWVIDMGPEGGDAGGRVVHQGPVAGLLRKASKSHTAAVLVEHMKRAQGAREAA